MKEKLKFLLISLLLLFSFCIKVSANTIDLNEKGSIEITLKENENKIENAEITIYFLGEADNINHNLVFTKNQELDCNININELNNDNLENKLSLCNIDNVKKYKSITNSNGIVKFNNLDLGLYLVKQTKNVEGYSDIDTFLVSIPKVENNKWVKDIKAKPKTDIYKVIDITIEKKWNSNSKDLPKEVTIELYEEDKLIDTIKLNDDNNWIYVFKNIKLSDKYSVKEVNIPKGYTPSYTVNDYTFTITNTDILANTGTIFYPIIILFSIGFILVLLGINIIKNENYE